MSTGKLAIRQINDTHGYLDEHQEMFWHGDGTSFERLGGFAKIKGYFDQVRREYGDTLHGTFPAVTVYVIAASPLLSISEMQPSVWTVV